MKHQVLPTPCPENVEIGGPPLLGMFPDLRPHLCFWLCLWLWAPARQRRAPLAGVTEPPVGVSQASFPPWALAGGPGERALFSVPCRGPLWLPHGSDPQGWAWSGAGGGGLAAPPLPHGAFQGLLGGRRRAWGPGAGGARAGEVRGSSSTRNGRSCRGVWGKALGRGPPPWHAGLLRHSVFGVRGGCRVINPVAGEAVARSLGIDLNNEGAGAAWTRASRRAGRGGERACASANGPPLLPLPRRGWGFSFVCTHIHTHTHVCMPTHSL